MEKAFVVSLVSAVVAGGMLGGAFTGGVMFGKNLGLEAARTAAPAANQEAPAATPTPAAAGGLGGGRLGAAGLLGQGGAGLGGGGVSGTVESVSGSTMTMNTPQGPVTVFLANGAMYQKLTASAGNAGDLQPGARVQVVGQRAEDGTMTARAVIINAGEPLSIQRGGGETRGGQRPRPTATP